MMINSSKTENFRQKILRKMYPIIVKLGKKGRNGTVLVNDKNKVPISSFYDLNIKLHSGKTLDFSKLQGKKVLIVNTASDCGYTGQYSDLQSLKEQSEYKLQIIGFPANDFGEQEKSDDNAIEQFCKVNYGVTFPLASKGTVLKKADQQKVFKWLSDKNMNGWNDHEPDWNFSKYLINEEGILTHYFGPSISPSDEVFLQSLK